LYQILLHLTDEWEVKGVEVKEPDELYVDIEFVSSKWKDPETGASCSLYDHREERLWRHLDTMQYKTYIRCKVPRVQLPSGKVITIEVPWADVIERHTYLLEKKVIDTLLCTKNQTKAAHLLRLSFNKIHRIMELAVKSGLERRDLGDTVKNISIDEKAFKRGSRTCGITVLSDSDNNCVLNVIEGRTKSRTCGKQLMNETFIPEQKENIETVCTDMWEAYINSVREILPNAKSRTCGNKFHLVKYLNQAVDKVRRQEVKKQHELKQTRYLWLKDKLNLTEKQRIKFDAIKEAYYETSKAWRVKENFRDISFHQPRESRMCGTLFIRWYNDALKSQLKPIIEVAEMFNRHMNGIINAMVCGRNNGKAERINGNIQELKVNARGYRNVQNFRNAILFFNGKLNLYTQGSG